MKLGTAALLDYALGSVTGVVQVTVTRIDKGSQADLSKLDGLNTEARQATPFYIYATVKNAGTTDLSHQPIDALTGLLPNGDQARRLSVIGTFTKCDSYPKTTRFPPGASFEFCSPALADPGTTVTGALWTDDPYTAFNGVAWTP